jgi:hypothetical protein
MVWVKFGRLQLKKKETGTKLGRQFFFKCQFDVLEAFLSFCG